METTTAATNLNSEELAALLKKLDACQEARNWVQGKDLVTAWTTCHRADWLLWLIKKAAPLDPITNELLICRFAREVHYLNSDPRVLACIETREAWARGEVSNEVRAAARAAATVAAWFGTRITAWDAAQAAATDIAATAAWSAAYAAAYAVVPDLAVYAAAKARQADIIRELVPMPAL